MSDGSRADRTREETEEAQRALDAVLQEQAARRSRAELAASAKRRGALATGLATLVLGVVSISIWTAPPPWARPPRIPAPSAERVEAGLRMDMWKAVEDIREFQADRRRLPVYLWEAVGAPPDATELSYERTSPEAFRLVGRRGDLAVEYESETPVDRLVRPAITVVRGGEAEG
jgi:hypothetical protein